MMAPSSLLPAFFPFASAITVEHYCHAMQGIVSPYRALGCSKVYEHSCFLMIPQIGGPVTASIQAQNSPP